MLVQKSFLFVIMSVISVSSFCWWQYSAITSIGLRSLLSLTSRSVKSQKIRMNSSQSSSPHHSVNVLGKPLQPCCYDPMTGFYRDGFCETGPADTGRHTVCAQVTEEFLSYTRSVGNDLSTPSPGYGFPGLTPGDKWCLCAARWYQAEMAGKAPPLYLESTHSKAVEIVPLEILKKYALDNIQEIDESNILQ
mmetsp:Transcript_14883/g.14987  ORF Transcript_14883/g.14987 Transcript_14883/m.14987 type:complete len:192 (+) Transcript_14883:181-756(+)